MGPFILELKNWSRKGEEMEEIGIHREDKMKSAASILFLEHELYTYFNRSLFRADQCQRESVQCNAGREEWSTSFATSLCSSLAAESIGNITSLKRSVMQLFADSSIGQR